jgi:hypothetical protein
MHDLFCSVSSLHVSLLQFRKLTPTTATRYVTRHKSRQVLVIEAEANEVDVCNLSSHIYQIFKFFTISAG